MPDDFFIRALLAGAGVGLIAALPGCFIIWRKMAFFGDTIAHAGLLGVALSLAFELPLSFGILLVGVVMSYLLFVMNRRAYFSSDALLGIFSHSSLALGVVVISLMPGLRVDLVSFFFGDILTVTRSDLAMIYGGGLVIVGVFLRLWKPLLCATVSPDIAKAEGLKPERCELIFLLLLSLVVVIAIRAVGLLLVSAFLILPGVSARQFARTPEMMALIASLIGFIAAIGGLYGSLMFDTPSGPTIVIAALVIFLCARLSARLIK